MIRKLRIDDAPRMLEWMHDDEVVKGLQAEIFKKKTLTDCENFIRESQDGKYNCHMAIVDENDVYQGTVSLKMIDYNYKDAEFAIVLRRDAQGHGYALDAMREIMKLAFEKYKLSEVYWNVFCKNSSAISLYQRGGYKELKEVSERRLERVPKKKQGVMEDIKFFHIIKEDYLSNKQEV